MADLDDKTLMLAAMMIPQLRPFNLAEVKNAEIGSKILFCCHINFLQFRLFGLKIKNCLWKVCHKNTADKDDCYVSEVW